jgi:outer membrane protein assembly factor BamB
LHALRENRIEFSKKDLHPRKERAPTPKHSEVGRNPDTITLRNPIFFSKWSPEMILLLFTAIAAADAGLDWPQFRGPNASGVSKSERIPIEWGEGKNQKWKKPLPGLAWSSPIVVNGMVIVTTAASDKPPEAPKKGLYFGGERPTPDAVFTLDVRAYDLATGDEKWKTELFKGKPTTPIHSKNTYASETPASDGESIVAAFGTFGVFGLDMNGKQRWKYDVGPLKTKMNWGTGSSPIIHEGVVYLQIDSEQKSSLVALDAKSGEEKWKEARQEKTSWATPFIWKNSKRTELVTNATNKVRSYDPKSGKLLWELGRNSSIAVPTPFAGDELLYVSSGYVMDMKNKPIYAVKPGVSGDITPQGTETMSAGLEWSQRFGGPYMPSPLLYDGRIYVLYDQGFLAGFDAKTGKEVYKRQRLGTGGQQFTASPWAARGMIFCASESGKTFVVKAGPKFEIVRTNELPGMIMATPALAGDKLIIRTGSALYCFGE